MSLSTKLGRGFLPGVIAKHFIDRKVLFWSDVFVAACVQVSFSLKFNFVLGYVSNRLAKMTTLIAILMTWKRNDNNAKNKDSRVWIRSIILYYFHFYFTDGKAQTPPIFLEMTWKLNVPWAVNRYHWKIRAKYHRELLWKCARGHRVTGGTALCEMSILRSGDSL